MEYIQMKYILKPLKLGGCYKIDRPNFSKVKLESIKIVKICIANKLDFNFFLHFFPLKFKMIWNSSQVEVDF
jgi:hypothetical protein